MDTWEELARELLPEEIEVAAANTRAGCLGNQCAKPFAYAMAARHDNYSRRPEWWAVELVCSEHLADVSLVAISEAPPVLQPPGPTTPPIKRTA